MLLYVICSIHGLRRVEEDGVKIVSSQCQ